MKRTTIAFLGLLLLATAILLISLPFIGAKQVYPGQSSNDAKSSTLVSGVEQDSPLPTPPGPIDLAAYQFGKPELVLQEKGPIWISGWQPDNHTLLFTTYNTDESLGAFEEVKTLDTTTGVVQMFGRRNFMLSRKPVLMKNEVAFFGADSFNKDAPATVDPNVKTRN